MGDRGRADVGMTSQTQWPKEFVIPTEYRVSNENSRGNFRLDKVTSRTCFIIRCSSTQEEENTGGHVEWQIRH
jgi:hypothetical protein